MRVYKRIGDLNVTFCEKGGTVKQVTDFFVQKIGTSVTCSDVAAEEGFEPSQNESESLVLPLHNSAIFNWCEGRDLNSQGINHTPLKRARLPIPPPSHGNELIIALKN